jgi:hypothetical protein
MSRKKLAQKSTGLTDEELKAMLVFPLKDRKEDNSWVLVTPELGVAMDAFTKTHGMDRASLVRLALSAYIRLQANLCFCLHSQSLHEEGGSQRCMLKSCTCRRFLGIGLGMVGKMGPGK